MIYAREIRLLAWNQLISIGTLLGISGVNFVTDVSIGVTGTVDAVDEYHRSVIDALILHLRDSF